MAKLQELESLYIEVDGERKEESYSKFLSRNAKEHKMENKAIEAMLKIVRKDGDFEVNDSATDEQREKLNAAYESVREQWDYHTNAELEIQEEAEKALAEETKLANKLHMVVAESYAVGLALKDSFLSSMQKAVGKKFVVGPTGLEVAKGETITLLDCGKAISVLCKGNENLDSFRATTTFATGDLILLTEQSFGEDEANKLVEQICEIHGRDKHTVVESRRVAAAFPKDQRHEELSYTHHQEIKNYRDNDAFKGARGEAKLNKIIEEAKTGGMRREIDKATGETVEQTAPVSCAELRRRLKEAVKGKASANGDQEQETVYDSSKCYFYVDSEGVVTTSMELDVDACATHLVISVSDAAIMAANGHVGQKIKERKVKKPKAKKEPKPKAEKPKRQAADTIPD